MDQRKIGAFIAALRKEKGLTQEELAQQFGVTQRSVSRWETGRNLPDLSLLQPLAEFFGVSLTDLLTGERAEAPSDPAENRSEEALKETVRYSGNVVKKWSRRLIAVILCVAICVAAGTVWWATPKRFLKGLGAQDVARISVFNGNNGHGFTVEDPKQIAMLVDRIQRTELQKRKISVGYTGYSFRMTFEAENGRTIESFIINAPNTIRKDPFFWYAIDGVLPYDELWALEGALYGEN